VTIFAPRIQGNTPSYIRLAEYCSCSLNFPFDSDTKQLTSEFLHGDTTLFISSRDSFIKSSSTASAVCFCSVIRKKTHHGVPMYAGRDDHSSLLTTPP
jgi:hypothetical protein